MLPGSLETRDPLLSQSRESMHCHWPSCRIQRRLLWSSPEPGFQDDIDILASFVCNFRIRFMVPKVILAHLYY